jgi:hypothetical protein
MPKVKRGRAKGEPGRAELGMRMKAGVELNTVRAGMEWDGSHADAVRGE